MVICDKVHLNNKQMDRINQITHIVWKKKRCTINFIIITAMGKDHWPLQFYYTHTHICSSAENNEKESVSYILTYTTYSYFVIFDRVEFKAK